jgi:hypothetical protein
LDGRLRKLAALDEQFDQAPLYRRASPRRQQAMLRALLRRVDDGVPWEECLVDAEIECGTPPEEAREMVRQALASPADPDCWRHALI